jgi:type II secretory pathway pseudopilin PulG
MNRKQKAILIEIITVIVITIIAIVVMISLRDYVNRKEAEMAMTILGKRIRQYRVENGLVPPEYWLDEQRENLPGEVRLGEFHYRARWIGVESAPDEILAYTEQKSRSLFFKNGFFVLRLKEVLPPYRGTNDDGQETRDVHIEWMESEEFKATLARQQSQMEIESWLR